jgi:hypothetical protein
MKAKTIITIVLLVFVAGSVVYLIAKEAGRAGQPQAASRQVDPGARAAVPATAPSPPAPSAPSSTAPSRPAPVTRKVVAYYFYGNFRCANCRRIEAWTANVVQTDFAEDLRGGQLAWVPVNVEQPGNQHFIRDYQLYTRSVVLVELENGRQTRYKNLQRVWQLLGSSEAFGAYIRQEVSAYLKG